MEILFIEVMEGYQSLIPYWPGDVTKSTSRCPWLTKADEVLVKQGNYCSVSPKSNIFISSDYNNIFPTQFLKTASLSNSILIYMKIKHIFNTIVYSCQTRMVPYPVLPLCVCHICCWLHIFLQIAQISIKISHPYWNNFNYVLFFYCYPMNHIIIVWLSITQGNTK